jgi:hypothetical protein
MSRSNSGLSRANFCSMALDSELLHILPSVIGVVTTIPVGCEISQTASISVSCRGCGATLAAGLVDDHGSDDLCEEHVLFRD